MEPLVDQYSRGALHGELGLGTFEAQLAAATGGGAAPPPAGSTFFDSRLGLAVRRWCPPLLGLEQHCTPVRYLARRRELGAYSAARALLRGSGIGTYLVGPDPDASGELTTPDELASAAEARAHEAVCLRQLAAQIADTSGTVGSFLTNTAEALYAAAREAIAFVSGDGFLEESAPELPEVHRAVGRWLRDRQRRLEPVLVRHLLWSALTTGRPVQLHCADPSPLTGFLHATSGLGATVILLPRAPHHRRAAQLAAAFPHVYADIGPRPAETLAEAPFGKLLFSTGARALPELYVVGARLFTGAMKRLLDDWVTDGCCGRGDAERIAARVAGGTARRVYALDAA
ncbi:amidohydrolase [Streptomyces gobiensis]|uniref:amidohydrolase n=1 Tax=Streptomyces gobiensis TaxID=2875706 RepID=UPI001E4A36AE|nr:amidohydrolase [Streptomyces gobiensis]UGY90726.1 amidohydrolase [Streptomyces gobiensis]